MEISLTGPRPRAGVPSDVVLATPGDKLPRCGKLPLTSLSVLSVSRDGAFEALLF